MLAYCGLVIYTLCMARSHIISGGSMNNNSINRDSDKFLMRLPNGMRDEIKINAAQNRRSMNAELVYLIEQGKRLVYETKNVEH